MMAKCYLHAVECSKKSFYNSRRMANPAPIAALKSLLTVSTLAIRDERYYRSDIVSRILALFGKYHISVIRQLFSITIRLDFKNP